MKDGGGKEKGNQFQRDTAKILSLWITGQERDDVLWSSTASGAQFTAANKNRKKEHPIAYKSQCGDLQALETEGKWLIDKFYWELKHYKKLGLEQFLIGTSSTLAQFWHDETVAPAASVDKIPALVAKQNYRPTLLLLPPAVSLAAKPITHSILHNCYVYQLNHVLEIPYQNFVQSCT